MWRPKISDCSCGCFDVWKQPQYHNLDTRDPAHTKDPAQQTSGRSIWLAINTIYASSSTQQNTKEVVSAVCSLMLLCTSFSSSLSRALASHRLPLLISLWWIMNNSLHFYRRQVMYEHVHLHSPDYRCYVYSWATELGSTYFLVWWPRWPRMSLMCGRHPSPPATNQ